MVPPRSMEHVTLEIFHAFKFDVPRLRDTANCGYQDRRISGELEFTKVIPKTDLPLAAVRVPLSAQAVDAKEHVRAEIVFIDSPLHIWKSFALV